MTARLALIALVLMRSLWSGSAAVIQAPKIDYGSNRILENLTVYGGIILNDRKSITATIFQKGDQQTASNHSEALVSDILNKRAKNVHSLVAAAPFELSKWPTINTRACPHYLHSGHNRIERGQGMAHMQIWMEFVFFDHDVLDARQRKTPEYITSNSYSSVSGIFTAVQNGSLYKNGIPFLDNDVMLVFEDTAVLLPNISTVPEDSSQWTRLLRQSLTSTSTDIISLGHHHSNHTEHSLHHHNARALLDSHASGGQITEHSPTAQVSANAYAITRAGARKLLKCYDLCGRLMEEQLRHCIESGLVSHSVVKEPMFACQH